MALGSAPGTNILSNFYDAVDTTLGSTNLTNSNHVDYLHGGIISVGIQWNTQSNQWIYQPMYNLTYIFSGIILCILISSVFKLIGITLKGIFGKGV